jgi:hypothetical protein
MDLQRPPALEERCFKSDDRETVARIDGTQSIVLAEKGRGVRSVKRSISKARGRTDKRRL